MKLGIDFGKVIMGPIINGKADTSFLGNTFKKAMETPPSAHAFECIAELVEISSGEAWIVSKCGQSVQNKTKAWLKHWDFFAATGFKKDNLRFCLKRHEKAVICKQLGITDFIDDRLDVLEPMSGVVENLYLFGEQICEIPDWVEHVPDWRSVVLTVNSVGRMSHVANTTLVKKQGLR
jgi:hypothetical protein